MYGPSRYFEHCQYQSYNWFFFLYLFADWDLLNLLELSQELILLLWSIPDTFFDPRNRRKRDLKDLLFFFAKPTECPPVANSPPRKFGQLFFGRHSGPNWSDFEQHFLLQQYKLIQRMSSPIYYHWFLVPGTVYMQ